MTLMDLMNSPISFSLLYSLSSVEISSLTLLFQIINQLLLFHFIFQIFIIDCLIQYSLLNFRT